MKLENGPRERVSFSDVIDSITDRIDNPSEAGVDRYVGLEHLDPGAMTVTRWDSPEKVEAQKLRFQPDDVIFGRRRAYQKKVARADFEGICSAHALVLRARPGIQVDFLPVFLSSNYFLDRAIEISVGSLSPTVNWRDLKIQEFDLPHLDEQQRIADLFWALERHRLSLQSVRRLSEAAHRTWLDTTINDVDAANHRTMGELMNDGEVSLLTGPFGSTLSAKEFIEGGVPVIHPSHIREGRATVDPKSTLPQERVNSLARWQVDEGDIVLMRKGDVGRSAIITAEQVGWIISSDCISIRLSSKSNLSPEFLRLALSAPSAMRTLLRNAPGTTMPGINEKSLRSILVPALSSVDQDGVIKKSRQLLGLVDSLASELDTLDTLRSSILAEVFGDS